MTRPRADIQRPTTTRRFVVTVDVPDDPEAITDASQRIVHAVTNLDINPQPYETVTITPIDGMDITLLDLTLASWRYVMREGPVDGGHELAAHLADAATTILDTLRGR